MSDDETRARIKAWLAERGVPEEELQRADRDDQLHLLVIDASVIPTGPRLTGPEIAERAGLPLEMTHRLWRALGFPDVPEDEPAFTELDAEAVTAARALSELGLIDVETAIQLARVIGSSMARIAEAEVSSTAVLPGEATSLELAEIYARSVESTVPTVARLLEYAWRRHLQAALRRATVVERDGEGGQATVAIGFADQVGSTALAQQLSERALAEVVARFEALAYDIVVQLGGRVVKMIGDEVMYVALDAAVAVNIGLALAEAYSDDEMLSDVRVGVAYGPVLLRDGDYYGPVVNKANRIVNIAVPGSVVVSDEVHTALAEEGRYEWRPLRPRYLKGLGKVSLWVVRREGASEDEQPFRSRRRWLLREPLREKVERTLGRLSSDNGDEGGK